MAFFIISIITIYAVSTSNNQTLSKQIIWYLIGFFIIFIMSKLICKKILDYGVNVKWYLIGYGSDESLIKEKIKDNKMEEHVFILGKKTNPYPYIKACDFYIQPSRYEGKAVTVREAQILFKPVIITRFPTSASQLTDGYDGIIVDMDNDGCAKGITNFIKNKNLQEKIIKNLKSNDYSNSNEIEKIYELVES